MDRDAPFVVRCYGCSSEYQGYAPGTLMGEDVALHVSGERRCSSCGGRMVEMYFVKVRGITGTYRVTRVIAD